MKSIMVAVVAAVFLSTYAEAEMQKLSEVSWWTAYGGINDDGTFTCAMVTTTPGGRGGKLVIEHVKGADVFLVRMLKPSWTIEKGARKSVALQFGYGRIWELPAIGSGIELRAAIPLQNFDAFMSGFQRAGRIDVTFIGGTEAPWELATGGGGFVEPDFIKCIRMSIPVKPEPPTQP
jgi:hypothetical protein